MKTIKTLREGANLDKLDKFVRPRFKHLRELAETLEDSVEKFSKKGAKELDAEIGAGTVKDFKKALKLATNIVDIIEDHEMDWFTHYDYNK